MVGGEMEGGRFEQAGGQTFPLRVLVLPKDSFTDYEKCEKGKGRS